MDTLRARTVAALSWSALAYVGKQGLGFGVAILLARLLTPRDFGLVGMAMVFVGITQTIGDLGLGPALIQRPNPEIRHLNAAFWMSVCSGLFATTIMIGAAPLISSFYREPSLTPLLLVLAINAFITSTGCVSSAMLQKHLSFRRIAGIEIASTLITGAIVVTMAAAGCGVWSLVAQLVISNLLNVTLTWRAAAWRPTIHLELTAARELLRFSLPLLGFHVMNYGVRNADNLIIGRSLGSAALGLYGRAYNLMALPVSQVSAIISTVMLPALSSIQQDIDRVRKAYLRAISIIGLAGFPVMIGLLAVARPFILVFFGDQWVETVPVLQVLCVIGVAQVIGTTVGWIYVSQARTDLMLKWGVASGFVYITAFIIGVRWGIVGVASAYVLSGYVLLLYPGWAIPARLINLSFGAMVRAVAAPFGCACAMGSVAWGVGQLLPAALPLWGILFAQVAAGAISYALLIASLQLRAFAELKQLVRERLRERI